MEPEPDLDEAIEGLQQLGLQEYEARCFVGLSRLSSGTAKKLSEITDVPRTRVYDAIRVLESKGLVAIHHSSPQEFRAVPIDEAMDTLRDQYETRIERIQHTLESVEKVDSDDESPVQEVWSMTGADGIENRTNELIANATEEILLVLGEESLLTEELIDSLNGVPAGVDVLVGTESESLQRRVHETIPEATVFTSGLEWLQAEHDGHHRISMGRILLVDRSAILVSSILDETGEEHAIYGRGFGNGFVVLARRMMARGLAVYRDPIADDD